MDGATFLAPCYRKLQREFTSVTWTSCNEVNVVGVISKTPFWETMLDVSYQQATGPQDPEDWDLPQCLQEIVGRTLTFYLNLSHFNFTAK
ncbi:hypothetical protein F2Q69_00003354 [Brassica cretica]|uniref:Uncharacterized protein n=1 Tax=Brassica cretica TaxID=69181 RepID=A0A8S9P8A4_BRACR|nr:hypothetical protein F2Q69_00003354 [Brassica cretica]